MPSDTVRRKRVFATRSALLLEEFRSDEMGKYRASYVRPSFCRERFGLREVRSCSLKAGEFFLFSRIGRFRILPFTA